MPDLFTSSDVSSLASVARGCVERSHSAFAVGGQRCCVVELPLAGHSPRSRQGSSRKADQKHAKDIRHLDSREGVDVALKVEKKDTRWDTSRHKLAAPPPNCYQNRPTRHGQGAVSKERVIHERVTKDLIRGAPMSSAEVERIVFNRQRMRMHCDPRNSKKRPVFVRAFEQTAPDVEPQGTRVAQKVLISSETVDKATSFQAVESSVRGDQHRGAETPDDGGIIALSKRSGALCAAVGGDVISSTTASGVPSPKMPMQAAASEGRAGSRAGSVDNSILLGQPLGTPRARPAVKTRTHGATSPEKRFADPQCFWGAWDNDMPRTSRRQAQPPLCAASILSSEHLRTNQRQARPPPSAASVLSAENLRAHERSLQGTPRSTSDRGCPSRNSSCSVRGGGVVSGARSPSQLGRAQGDARPSTARSPRPSWKQLVEEAEVGKPLRRFDALAAEAEQEQSPLAPRRPHSVDVLSTCNGRDGFLALVSDRHSRRGPFAAQDSSVGAVSLTWQTGGRRLLRSGSCAPARGSWGVIFPMRELHPSPVPPSVTR
mmetsp:Transcript_61792/g.172592  ORF Transcript_61792/g.172592 Transcript_61792/m.172592 type:complete len:545 (+) Transcript_61792:2-1636(+)